MSVRILHGDCRDVLKTLPSASVQCCVTSPPYFGLRDYGVDGQIGMEQSPDAYIAELVAVFREVRRVLRDDGVLFLNLGDSYCSASGTGDNVPQTKNPNVAFPTGAPHRSLRPGNPDKNHGNSNRDGLTVPGLKPKDLIGIPWMAAFALRADGWWLRRDIIWSKPNPMPESVTDRPTSAHEYVFLLTKSARYFWDAEAVREPMAAASVARLAQDVEGQKGSLRANGGAKTNGPMKAVAKGNAKTFRGGGAYTRGRSFDNDAMVERDSHGNAPNESCSRNLRSVWTIATQPYSEAHFATFPPALAERCILAGSRPGDTVIDPFGGAGTVGLVADRLGRDAVLIELNQTYIQIAEKRLNRDAGMFASVEIVPACARSPVIPPENDTTDKALSGSIARVSENSEKDQCDAR